MKAWSTWLPDLLPHLPGCPVVLVEHEVKRAAQAFFKSSRTWLTYSNTMAVDADQADVAMSLASAEQELVRVEKAWLDGRPLNVKTADEMDAANADDWQAHTGAATTVVQTSPGTVRLYPVPTSAAIVGLKCRVSVKPSEAGTGVPDDLAELYRDALTSGAKGRLMMASGKPWANPDAALLEQGKFEAEISKARLNAAKSFGRGRLAANPKWA